jgi:F-type H+-transporting ATPase subunit b
MHIDGWTLALQTINVVVLIWLLSRFLYRPVVAAIADRQAAAAKILADAEASRNAAAAEAADLQRRTEAFAAGEADLLAEARARAGAERAELLRAAAAEATKLRAAAQADLEREAAAARKRLEADAAGLAVAIARKLLHRAPAAPVVDAMFGDLLNRLRALAPDERVKLVDPGAALSLTTAEPLAPAQQARCAAALREALPGLGDLAFEVDPDLIAGFELAGPNLVVNNSWRADLAQIAAALAPASGAEHVA